MINTTLKRVLWGILVIQPFMISAQQLPTLESQGQGVWRTTEGVTHLTLDDAIFAAQNQSIAAMTAKYTFLSSYWSYRSHKASLLPSLNLTGNLLSFDRSLSLLQDYDTGDLRYFENYNMQNQIGLSLRQNIALTGGTLSVYSSLNRLDQFGSMDRKSYYSQPITLSYTQPLFAYNSLKWAKKIEPKEYELAKRHYIEAMEDVTARAVSYFFSLALSEANHRKAQKNYENTKSLYAIAEQRLKIGSISKDELLQLELRMLNDSLSINNTALSLREQQMRLTSFLRLKENTTVEPIINEEIPVIALDYEMVLSKALSNSSFELENEIALLNAEASIAQAKANRGASASFNARFGLSQTASELGAAYANLLDQEVVGLQFSVPIFDWGMGKGRVKMAKARAEMTRSQIEQAEIDYRHEVYTLLEQFTNQRNQCEVSRRAQAIALDRYAIAMDNFRRGTLSVTEMNTAQSEKDSAEQTYISSLATFWNYYYQLRRLTLYDFMTKTDIEAEFEKIIKE